MNYRHAFHAGNFADVAKHAVLALLIEHLKTKDAGFRVIDTHAGAGRYTLTDGPAQRTLEWQRGIARVYEAAPAPDLKRLLTPYLGSVHALNPNGLLKVYPGSPVLARTLLRAQDRLTAVELHPEDGRALSKEFAGDVQTRVISLDGWLALGAFLPPKERRGLVLVDPPYEERGEFERMATAFAKAHKRWPGGVYALWYPVKDRYESRNFLDGLKASGIPKLVAAELIIRRPGLVPTLDGSGMVIANPPWGIEEEIEALLAGLAPILAEGPGAESRLERLTGES